jgi:LmbE family N-acetylglucosaminyl deacetylase
METRLGRLLRFLYSHTLPHAVRSALRLQFELLRRMDTPAVVNAPAACTILVLSPHMDDDVFGCGGTLAQSVHCGSNVVVAYMTDGSKGFAQELSPALAASERQTLQHQLTMTRKAEAQCAADLLGWRELVFLDLPDGALAVTPEAVERLSAVLHRVSPDVVYLPFLTDTHADHWMTNCLFIEAAQHVTLPATLTCWGYEVWAPVVANTIVDITETMALKQQAMQVFVSQIGHYDYPQAIVGLNQYRSIQHQRGRFAEAFYVAELPLYRALYEQVLVTRRPGRSVS